MKPSTSCVTARRILTSWWEDGNLIGAGQWRALGLPSALQDKIHPTQVYSI